MDDTAYERAFLAARQMAEIEAAKKAVNPTVKKVHRDLAKLYEQHLNELSSVTMGSD